jgi:hypothetical protein
MARLGVEATARVPTRNAAEAAARRRVVCGLALAGIAGAFLGQAWTSQDGSWSLLGVGTLLSASLMVLSAAYIRTVPDLLCRAGQNAEAVRRAPVAERWETQPMLGEILVEHGHITSDELLLALRRQAETHLPLGEMLVDMHLVSLEQISAAMGEQSAWQNARLLPQARGSRHFRIVAHVGQSTAHP